MALAASASSSVIVTRPEREAKAWADDLQARGVRCETLPLIEIAALPEPSVLTPVWQEVHKHLAVMFVSANAVRFFMAARPDNLSLNDCRAWSTGPGTRAALLQAAWPADWIDSPDEAASQFDSEALWSLVAHRVEADVKRWQALNLTASAEQPSVLIVRGADAQGQLAGRDWLALQMEAAGLRVHQTVAYVRQPPRLTPGQQQRARQAMSDGSRWLFSSSEAAQYLMQACPDLPLDHAKALATHPRIAQKLRQSGWPCVELVPPGLQAQAQSIKSSP
ncbi:MAG: uroporphyrinogen-III synthase [Limnohabitans sp.]|jgi:uroporphyrinogen-III synthase|uniref:uroporphyrinogen-III synthase n=1 Tax=Limnohabitans sp. TaxID=1907725 RepID=UPI0025EB88C6|nr:uroporphyrinogen-III synthase [Limnohabitans sp.]MCO4087973.1 uroporphyrinogen-III synthase [Limnohabitans sp.]